MAASKEPVKRRAPVRKRLPKEAEEKLNIEVGGRARLRISRLRWLSMLRISSRWGGDNGAQSEEVPATRRCQDARARSEDVGRR